MDPADQPPQTALGACWTPADMERFVQEHRERRAARDLAAAFSASRELQRQYKQENEKAAKGLKGV